MAARDRARSSLPDGSGPTTRRRLASSTCTPGPCLRQAISPALANTHRPQDSGTRQTSHQARAYDAEFRRPFSADSRLLIAALRNLCLPRGRSALGGLPGFGRLGPRRRDTATALGGPYAAFGPAAAALRFSSLCS